jgi:myo-inositol 2-dehydrogenase/D-chiro-inositol 1-dehydrogenase
MMGQEHLRDLLALPGAEVVAVADTDSGSLEAARALLGRDVPAYPGARQLVENEDVDVVVVATPNHTHAAVLDDLLGRPLHVLVEKPLATTLEDCRALVRRAAEHPGLVWVGLEYRYVLPVRRLLEIVGSGAIGRPRMVSLREHRFPFLDKVGGWNRLSRLTGGTLVEKCCHFFDLMRLVLGDPVRAYASGGRDVNHLDERVDGEVPDILDNAYAVIDFSGGTRAALDLCMFAEASPFEQEIVVVGDAGRVEARIPGFVESCRGRRAELVVGTRGGDWQLVEERLGDDPAAARLGLHHGASYLEHVAFAAAMDAGGPVEVSVLDGAWSVATGIAAEQSVREGAPVAVERP